MKNKVVGIVSVLGFLLLFYFSGTQSAYPEMQDEEKIKVPPPSEVRNFSPQPNRIMFVTYANDRVFGFRIKRIIPRSDCNQVSVDERNSLRIITQAISQAHEYVLEPLPIMISEWLPYEE